MLSRLRPFVHLRVVHGARGWHYGNSSLSTSCWKCGTRQSSEGGAGKKLSLFCDEPSCGVIQELPAVVDFYNLLDIPGHDKEHVSFDIDVILLEKSFKNLQKRVHPDLYTNESLMEQELSSQHSSLINQAYNTLKNPVKRAAYVLKYYYNVDALAETSGTYDDPAVNMEVFLLRETVDELNYKDTSPQNKKLIDEALHEIKDKEEKAISQFQTMCQEQDIHGMTKAAIMMKYISKAKDSMEEQMID